MEVLVEISTPISGEEYIVRRAARGLVHDKKTDKFAVMKVGKWSSYFFPGGGIENEETPEEALCREMTEEIGARIENIRELGLSIQYRNVRKRVQMDYCYLCDLVVIDQVPSLTEKEIEARVSIEWYTMDELIKLYENLNLKEERDFKKDREISMIKKAITIINK